MAFRVDTEIGLQRYFEQAMPAAYRVVSRLTGGDRALTEEAVQDALERLATEVASGRLVEVDVGWLVTAARHRMLNEVRRRAREEVRLLRYAVERSGLDPGTDLPGEQVRWILGRLPLEQRVALGLQLVEGLSVAEIAAEISRSAEAVSSLLARARRSLRSLAEEIPDAF